MPDKKEPVCARYLMYTKADRTQAYRLDVENGGPGECYFWVNGEPKLVTQEDAATVLMALMTLDTAFGNLMLHEG